MDLRQIGATVRERRKALGITQAHLARMSGLSRHTVVGLERGSLQDLGVNRVNRMLWVLGLALGAPSTAARSKKRGLWMAAKNSSVSYRRELDEAVLAQTLATGQIPPAFAAHVSHLLGEAPMQILVMAVEETAQRTDVTARTIWGHIGRMARSLGIDRPGVGQ